MNNTSQLASEVSTLSKQGEAEKAEPVGTVKWDTGLREFGIALCRESIETLNVIWISWDTSINPKVLPIQITRHASPKKI